MCKEEGSFTMRMLTLMKIVGVYRFGMLSGSDELIFLS